MEKGKVRAAAAIWSAILLVTVCMGCGNRKKPDKPVVEDSGKETVVWVPEYKTLEQVFRMQAACGTEDGIYYCVEDYEEETKSQGIKLFFLDGESKQVSGISFDGKKAGYIASATQMAVLSGGDIVLVMQETDMQPEAGRSRQFLRLISGKDGSLTAELELTNEDGFVPSMAVNREDQIFLTDAAGGIKIYNQELQEVSSIALPAKVQPWGVGICKEGEAVCLGYGSDSDLAELYVLDADAGNVAKVCQ